MTPSKSRRPTCAGYNEMLRLALKADDTARLHQHEPPRLALEGNPIVTADHCDGCTAEQGLSRGGALTADGDSP